MWDLRRYNDLPMNAPHENSTFYIAPKSTMSCMSSLIFPITGEGTVDINLYIDLITHLDQIVILVFQSMPNELDAVVASVVLSAADPNLARGWQTVKVTLVGLGAYNGYVTLMGVASESSVILIDSIRYIAPSHSEELCPIYEEDYTTDGGYKTTLAETTSDDYPNDLSTSSLKTTTDMTSTNSLETTKVTTSTSGPDITTETSSKTTLDTTTENFPHTISTSSPDTSTETTSTTSLETTTENDQEACSITSKCNLRKTDVRVNVNINIK
ncbi:A-agglutinin anchorage subunit-like [Vanessa atalanta]|uniref:A-agglutinin anchorage subunit-like n=1 Tax=Vanessa atalanta TaxID=42275 RepID=UPI001FCD0441|nr:A-agglutinin anchorage subunit-like [Vanessa atalanta]